MSKHTKSVTKLHSQHALLCLLGHLAQAQGWFEPVRQLVTIRQKILVHSPADKLLDCLLGLLCGCQSVCQINTRLAVDPAVSRAWGRTQCADQSTIQQTLDAATPENVVQMRQALAQIFARFSQTARHPYAQRVLVLDLDLTGLPCSARYEAATAGYFAGCKKGTKGRQLCRVSASEYNEIVYEQVFPGNTGSAQLDVFKQVVAGALQVLTQANPGVTPQRLLLRLDGGYGTREIVNYLLEQGFDFIVKLHSTPRARNLASSVAQNDWHLAADGERSWARLGEEANQERLKRKGQAPVPFYTATRTHERHLEQIAVRCPKKPKPNPNPKAKVAAAGGRSPQKGEIGRQQAQAQAVLEGLETEAKVSAQTEYAYSVLLVARRECKPIGENEAEAETAKLAELGKQVEFYDDRAAIESASFRGDKQGLALIKRRKKSLTGQEMLVLLSQLAHNFIIWAKAELVAHETGFAQYGICRWVRDILSIPGRVTFCEETAGQAGQIVKLRLSRRHALVRRWFGSLTNYFAKNGYRLILDET